MVTIPTIELAARANDPVALYSEILALDDALKVAFEFKLTNPQTLIVVVSDHESGGV